MNRGRAIPFAVSPSSRKANDSVTALSPRWRNSKGELRVGAPVVLRVAASWKSAA